MRQDTAPGMIAQSALTAFCDHFSPIIESLEPVSVDLLGRGTFSVTLKNGKTYRVTVAEESEKL